jgi:hypothetical protein
VVVAISNETLDSPRAQVLCLPRGLDGLYPQPTVRCWEEYDTRGPFQARSLVVCVRLPTDGVESPLFNPGVRGRASAGDSHAPMGGAASRVLSMLRVSRSCFAPYVRQPFP